jgi:hypothetical protein
MTVLPDRQMYSDGELARAAAGDRRPHGRQTVAGLGAEGEPEAATGIPHPADHELGPGLELPPPPWYRRPGILSAAALAALIAIVGVSVSVPGEPGTAPDGTTGTSTRWSASISMIATGWWTPDPPAPPAAEPPPAAPAPAAPQPAAAPVWAPAPAPPPVAAPPPPPPSELVLRVDNGTTIVSITHNANKPPVGCVLRTVAVAGEATLIHFEASDNFTVAGSGEARIGPHGPATGSTFQLTATCDNGLSASQDATF